MEDLRFAASRLRRASEELAVLARELDTISTRDDAERLLASALSRLSSVIRELEAEEFSLSDAIRRVRLESLRRRGSPW
jgi:translation initiation factor 2B subunit (eIF-2B alpha/beta/delta family)